jgi:hypothetical protein
MMALVRIAVGSAVLLAGRKLYWLFVGAAGFALGLGLASRFLDRQPTWIMLLIALAAGLAGTLLALFVQRMAIGIAGFASGMYIATSLVNAFLRDTTGWKSWLMVFAGGILGAVLIGVLFDWALIVLSSLTGAGLIVQSLSLQPLLLALFFAVLVAAGIVTQMNAMKREGKQGR